MKGIGIVLVLLGHVPQSSFGIIAGVDMSVAFSVIKHIIYSFHMPLFFLLAGYTAKCYVFTWGGYSHIIYKKFSRLIIPYLMSYSLLIIWSSVKALYNHNWMMPIRHILSMLWGSQEPLGEVTFNSCFSGVYITHMWFLWAMFLGILAFYLVVNWKKYFLWISIGISIIACLCYPYTRSWCPWCIMEGLSALTFIACGYWIKNHQISPWFWALCIVAWIVSIIYFPLNMASNGYGCYPINILGGIGGTFSVYWLARCINKLKFSRKIWIALGIISLPILCFHEIEPLTDIVNSIRIRLIPYFVLSDISWITIRYICIITIAYLCSKIPYIRRVYVQ